MRFKRDLNSNFRVASHISSCLTAWHLKTCVKFSNVNTWTVTLFSGSIWKPAYVQTIIISFSHTHTHTGWKQTHSAAVSFGLVNTLHGQHVVDTRVQSHLIHYGNPRLLRTDTHKDARRHSHLALDNKLFMTRFIQLHPITLAKLCLGECENSPLVSKLWKSILLVCCVLGHHLLCSSFMAGLR